MNQKTTAFMLLLALSSYPFASAGAAFEETFELQGITFTVASANDSSVSIVKLGASGLEGGDESLELEADGQVTGAEIADLDANGWPEIYIYVSSAGSGSYGSLMAYAVNNGKSISGIYLAPVADNPDANAGYMGHDEFAVVENNLVQRFPVYREGDSNAAPTGGMRQVQYKLKAGEAGWILRADKVVEFD